MKFAALLLLFAVSSCAQSSNPFFDFLPVLRSYLALSSGQADSIARAIQEHNEWVLGKRQRLAQVQREIQEERKRPSLDAAALGVRMVETEAICRELAARFAEQRQKLYSLLTEAQRSKLTALDDALKLVPAIQEAQSIGVIGEPFITYAGVTIFNADAFSRTDGTRFGSAGDAACVSTVYPGNIIPAARIVRP